MAIYPTIFQTLAGYFNLLVFVTAAPMESDEARVLRSRRFEPLGHFPNTTVDRVVDNVLTTCPSEAKSPVMYDVHRLCPLPVRILAMLLCRMSWNPPLRRSAVHVCTDGHDLGASCGCT